MDTAPTGAYINVAGLERAELLSPLSGDSMLAAAAMLLAFIVVLFVGSMLLPGKRYELTDADGKSRTCKLNGFALFLATLIVAGVAQYAGWFSLSVLHAHFVPLFVVANAFAFGLAGWLYWQGAGTQGAPEGFWRGFFYGRTFNPVRLGMDLKFYSYRPSLIGLALFNLSFAAVQYETYGELTLAMTLYQAFTLLYVLNYFQFEYGMIHTWDIVSERFGWGLAWGNFVLVPFFYCIAGWWLVHAPDALSPIAATGLVALFAFGFWMFRGANQQKHRFRQNPNISIWGRPVETLEGRLLVSGFWGVGRHLNYTGEICIYLAFLLTTGFESWVPWLLPAWLTGLLVHRSRRDDRRCQAKYGALWDEYKQRVRFSMLPYVY